MKTALVTGADGFIGSHLVEALLDRGVKVRAFVYYNAFGSWGWLDTLTKEQQARIEIVPGDIRDPHGVRKAMEGAEVVFHLAALIGIPFSYHSPDAYIDTNVKGTLNILQAARELKTRRLLVTSTSEVYGTAQYVPIDEKHPRQGQSPYSASKIAADYLAESFYRSFDVPIVIVRPFNTYGPRQSARAVIPTIITQLMNGAKKVRLGALTPTRDFTYVEDTVRGFLALASAPKAVGQDINIASGTEISVEEVFLKIQSKLGIKAHIAVERQRLRPSKSEVDRLLGSSKKMRAITGWKPAVSFDNGLDQTIDWFRNNSKGYRSHIYHV